MSVSNEVVTFDIPKAFGRASFPHKCNSYVIYVQVFSLISSFLSLIGYFL